MLSVRSAMRRAANSNADRIAIVSGDRQLTFGEAWDRGLRLANGLLDLGLKPGDRVAVLEDNCTEAADFFLGTAAANLVRVPLYKRNSAESHVYMIQHTGCRALVVSEDLLGELGDLKTAMPELEHVVVRSNDYENWLLSQRNTDPDPAIDLDEYYIIRHSGGTTGKSKGMAFSHRSWMETERDWTYRLPTIEVGDGCTHVAPISHGSGYLFVPIWLAGGYNILERKFDPSRFLDMLEGAGGYAFVVPTMLSDIVALHQQGGQAKRNFEALKALAIAGAPIREATAKAAHGIFGDKMHQFFGQTEAVPVTWMTSKEWFREIPGSSPLASVGRVMPFAQVEIRDEDSNAVLPVGQAGEIAVQVDGQVRSIWNEPEMTARRIVDNWILTGDIGYLDKNGYLYLVDRKDDLIISGGFNIWPAELEIIISAHPNVREVAVVSAPHPRWGETPAAIVVVHEEGRLTEADVIELCAAKLGGYKKPTVVVMQTESLPRTPVGKIPRKALRERFWGSQVSRIGGA